MRYKNSDDNRYRVQFMRSTEELMDQLTVKEFISYLEENAEFEQRSFYLLLCMTGRTQEATEYREKIEKQEDNTDGENIQE